MSAHQEDTFNQRLLELLLRFPNEFHQTFRFTICSVNTATTTAAAAAATTTTKTTATTTSRNGSSSSSIGSTSREIVVYNPRRNDDKVRTQKQRWMEFVALVTGSALVECIQQGKKHEERKAVESSSRSPSFCTHESSVGVGVGVVDSSRRSTSGTDTTTIFEIEDGIIGALEDEIEDLELELEDVKRQYKKQRQKNKELTEFFETHRHEKIAMERKCAEWKAELAAVQSDLDDRIERYESALAEKDLLLLTLTHDDNHQQQQLLRACEERDHLAKRIGHLESTLEQNRIRIRTLSEERDKAHWSLRRTHRAVDILVRKVERLEHRSSGTAATTTTTTTADTNNNIMTKEAAAAAAAAVTDHDRKNDGGASHNNLLNKAGGGSFGIGLLNSIQEWRVPTTWVSNAQ